MTSHPAVPAASQDQTLCAILFATDLAHPQLPVPADTPAALLPLGHATLVERHIECLVRAGVSHVHLVVSASPELIRRQVGQTLRWGVNLSWHWAQDPKRPYASLSSPALRGYQRLLIGHVGAWVDAQVIGELVQRDGAPTLLNSQGKAQWCGWASAPQALFVREPGSACASMDHASLSHMLTGAAPVKRVLAPEQGCLELNGARLLGLQNVKPSSAGGFDPKQTETLRASEVHHLPEHWIKTPWGAHSPSARIHPGARIDGPALIGPGCHVAESAHLGPGSWLVKDVVVSQGCVLEDALIFPGTYISRDLELRQVLIAGNCAFHLRHQVQTALPLADGLLKPLGVAQTAGMAHAQTQMGHWSGRVLAAGLVTATAPVALAALACRALAGQAVLWQRLPSSMVLRISQSGAGLVIETGVTSGSLNKALVLWARLGDVALGRMAWFGARLRTAAQWQALHPHWHSLLMEAKVGLLHEPAWSEDEREHAEAQAAADAYYAARAGWRENLRILALAVRARMLPPTHQLRAKQAGVVVPELRSCA